MQQSRLPVGTSGDGFEKRYVVGGNEDFSHHVSHRTEELLTVDYCVAAYLERHARICRFARFLRNGGPVDGTSHERSHVIDEDGGNVSQSDGCNIMSGAVSKKQMDE